MEGRRRLCNLKAWQVPEASRDDFPGAARKLPGKTASQPAASSISGHRVTKTVITCHTPYLIPPKGIEYPLLSVPVGLHFVQW